MASSPEYSTILAHIADINERIAAADLATTAVELLQAGLITPPSYDSAIAANGRAPQDKIASLTAEAMAKIKTSPQLFEALVLILENRDQELAFILRRECSESSSQLVTQGVALFPGASTSAQSRAKPSELPQLL